MSLVELIGALMIFGVVFIAMSSIFSKLGSYTASLKNSNTIYAEFLSAYMSLQNRLLGAKNLAIQDSIIVFYELEHRLMTQETNFYSGFANLDDNVTNKTQIATQNLAFSMDEPLFIGFNENLYAIESIENNKIVLKDQLASKTFSENYFLYKYTQLKCKDSYLYLNNSVLLSELSDCSLVLEGTKIRANWCKYASNDQKICKTFEMIR